MMILPISYIAIKSGASPVIAYVLVICVYPMAMLMDLYIIHKYTAFSLLRFIGDVVIKSVFFVTMAAVITNYSICNVLPVSFTRLLYTTGLSTITFLIIILLFGLTKGEKLIFKRLILSRLFIVHE